VQWVIWEAKSRAIDTGWIGPQNVQQAGGQLRTVQADRDAMAPGDAVCLLVSRKPNVLPSARNVAEEHVFLVRPQEVLDVFDRVVRAWQKLRGRGLPAVDAAGTAEIFRSEGALPTQWLPALRDFPLRRLSRNQGVNSARQADQAVPPVCPSRRHPAGAGAQLRLTLQPPGSQHGLARSWRRGRMASANRRSARAVDWPAG
jgi:hypothetical protein